MQTETAYISPEHAKLLLTNNKVNRKVSRSTVTAYASDMLSGSWRLTHQGLMLGKDDCVIDGQHRLLAVVQTGVGQWFLVSRDPSLVGPKDLPVDRNYKRDAHFILDIHPMLSAASSQAVQHGYGVGAVSVAQIGRAAAILAPHFEQLMGGCYASRRGVSTAPVHLAGAVRIALGASPAYVRDTYKSLSLSDFQAMPPVAASFYKQVVVDRVAFTSRELITRAIRMFDASRKNLKKMQVKDEAFAFDESRELILDALESRGFTL